MAKTATITVRSTAEAKRLLREIAEAKGISMAAVLVLAIRAMAKKEGIR